MIKFILQAILSYVVSIFLLPTTLVDSIEKMMNYFWWSHGRTSQRGIRLYQKSFVAGKLEKEHTQNELTI